MRARQSAFCRLSEGEPASERASEPQLTRGQHILNAE